MKKYGIVDTGSNTIVLIVYVLNDGIPEVIHYESVPAHLIDYVSDHVMSREGIDKAAETLRYYAGILDEMQVGIRYADITEPCRIENAQELIGVMESAGFHVIPLTGEEEAASDFYGAMLSYPQIRDGIAFDVGGGSTELISFHDGTITDAMSFPLGCVRLAHLPLDTDACRRALEDARKQYLSLDTQVNVIIGIGGTMRAAGLLADSIFHTSHILKVSDLRELFVRLCEKEPEAVSAMEKIVNAARIPVFLPGIHMILEICDIYGAETIYISDTGIREGFLLRYVIPACESL